MRWLANEFSGAPVVACGLLRTLDMLRLFDRTARATLLLLTLGVVAGACGGAIDNADPAGAGGSGAGASGAGGAGGAGDGTRGGVVPGTPGLPDSPPPATRPGPPGVPASPAPTDGPWGTWQLTGLDGPPGQLDPKAPPALELSLRADGTAVRYRCARSEAPSASTPYPAPCPAASSYECLAGKVFWDGWRWRVDIPAIRVGNVPEQGEIVTETAGGILIRYIYPTYSGGHFLRFSGDPSPVACEGL